MKTKTKKATVKRPEISSKIAVADFLTGKSFLNSREAFRVYKTENPTAKIEQAYFYTLFSMFGTRAKKNTNALSAIATTTHKSCMSAYREYKLASTPGEKVVVFAYFLTLWKKHFNLTGSIRQKKVKVVEPELFKMIDLSVLTAKQIIATATELFKEKAVTLPTNLKNKAGILKSATTLFKSEGYQVA